MAGEGLKFTGEAVFSNVNLIEEAQAREELTLKREEQELINQDAAMARKDARKRNQVKPESYALDDMNPFYAKVMANSVTPYQEYVDKNSLDFDDNIDTKTEKRRQETNLNLLANSLKSYSSDIKSYESLIQNGRGGNFILAEDGSYLFEYNLRKQEEAFSEGMPFNEAVKTYPTGAEDVMKRTKFKDPTEVLFEAADSERFNKGNDGDFYITGIEPQVKEQAQKTIINSLRVNSQGFHNDTDYQILYNTKLLTVDGEEMSAKRAFFKEAYVDPETEQVGGISGSSNLLDILDPENKRFDKNASNAYADYLGRKISEEGFASRGDKQGGKFTEPTPVSEDKNSLSQDRINFFMGDSEETEPYGLSNLKVSPNFGEDITDAGIVVSLTKASPIKEQGEVKIKEFNDLWQVSNSDGTNSPAEGKVSWVGITTSGKTVARVEFSGQSFLIDLADIASERNHVKPGATTALDLFKLAEGESKSSSKTDSNGVGSKYKKQR